MQSNFGIQHEFHSFLVSGQYLGNLGRKLTTGNLSMNQIAPNRGHIQQSAMTRPFPQFTRSHADSPNLGSSSYYALLLRVERRYTERAATAVQLHFLEADRQCQRADGPGRRAGLSGLLQPALDSSISSLDIAHNISGSLVYDLPWGPGRRWMSTGARAALSADGRFRR